MNTKLIIVLVLIMISISCEKPEESDITAPVIKITSPASDSIVTGLTIISAEVTDDNNIILLEFFIDSVRIGYTDKQPWEYLWNTENWADGGQHIIKLEATDENENIGISPLRIVTVKNNNTAPTASYTVTPSSGDTETEFIFNASGCTDCVF